MISVILVILLCFVGCQDNTNNEGLMTCQSIQDCINDFEWRCIDSICRRIGGIKMSSKPGNTIGSDKVNNSTEPSITESNGLTLKKSVEEKEIDGTVEPSQSIEEKQSDNRNLRH